jgi:hypothetical protein
VTTSPMLKFSNKKRSYVSRPCCWSCGYAVKGRAGLQNGGPLSL